MCMNSQLIVVDFTKVHRQIEFEKLTGFTSQTVSYYCDALFEHFSAYLFNYERWGSRPVYQLVFKFTEPVEPTPQNEPKAPYTEAVNAMVIELTQRYRHIANADLVFVEHEDYHTTCGFTLSEKYPEPLTTLDWLVKPIEETEDAGPITVDEKESSA